MGLVLSGMVSDAEDDHDGGDDDDDDEGWGWNSLLPVNILPCDPFTEISLVFIEHLVPIRHLLEGVWHQAWQSSGNKIHF